MAVPTETVYGLAVDAAQPEAVAAVFALKGRPADHPLIVHLPALPAAALVDLAAAWRDRLAQWADPVPAAAVRLACACWPGPLTLILRKQPWVPEAVTGGQRTVGLRVPAHPVAQALLEELQALKGAAAPCGVAAPSANRFGHVSPTTAAHVLAEFPGRLGAASALGANGALPAGMSGVVLDGGPCSIGVESTIVDLTSTGPRILRHGAITSLQIDAALAGMLRASDTPGPEPPPRVPGNLEQHYAPRAQVVLIEDNGIADFVERMGAGDRALAGIALIGPERQLSPLDGTAPLKLLPLPDDVAGQARGLYAALREADDRGMQLVGVVMPPPTGIGLAIRERLHRAAGLRWSAPGEL